MAVVLLVALAFGLDLAATGDGALLAAQLRQVAAAGVVEAAGELLFQPGVEVGVWPYGELAHQGVRVQLRQAGAFRLAHPVVDQASTQVGAVHPLGDLLIVCIRHQQRQTEIVQHALDGALPVALFITHLDQLTGKGQRLHWQPGALAQPLTQCQHGGRDVGATLA